MTPRITTATISGLAIWLASGLAARVTWADEATEKPAPRPHVQRLAEYGLSPTAESLSACLVSLVPMPERRAELEALVAQLGDATYSRREGATQRLVREPAAAGLLTAAAAGNNPEIRWRARAVLDQSDGTTRGLVGAVLTAIREERLSGLTRPLFDATPLCQDESLRLAWRRALAATATASDAPLLREQLASTDALRRSLAIATLEHVLGAAADADAIPLLNDSSEQVQAAAARALANHGRREALPVLVHLLSAGDLDARVEASRVLYAATGQQFGYTAYDAPAPRSAAIGQWKQWLAEQGGTATLTFPLREPSNLGRLLVCDSAQNLLIEFDAVNDRKLWQQTTGLQPWACCGTASGSRLVASYNEKDIVEYDASGREVWRYTGLPGGPTSVERLASGNTLVSCTDAGVVLEIDPAGKTVWKADLGGRPVDAHRLDDGRTLVALQHAQKVVEIDAAGQQVWELAGVGMVFSAQRVESGNTLVCSVRVPQVREFDRRGNVVWAKGNFVNPSGAQRLAGGNTLVVDATGVTEIDAAGVSVHRLEMINLSRVMRY